MATTYTQDERRLVLSTPLGKDVLLLTRFSGQEEMSRLFGYQLEMVSEKDSIAPKDIVGKNVTIALRLLDDFPRYFNGFVSRFAYCGTDDRLSHYTAEVVPWVWFLTKSATCRIFQKQSVVKIIEKVFGDLGFTDYEVAEIKGAHDEWEYCVQYRETDFNFVSRLLEQEGIFYFFRHDNGKHTLVLADQKGAHKDCLEKEVEFSATLGAPQRTDMITAWEHKYQFLTGKWAHTDYNFETPSAKLMAKTNSLIKLDGMSNFEIYDYPGEYEKKAQGDSDVKLRMEEEEVSHDVVNAASKCRTFATGGKFKIKKHVSKAEEGKTYVITSIHHAAAVTGAYVTGGGAASEVDYSNRFTCIPDSVTFRPARITPKPLVQGSQSAVVVGPKGEEIYTDKYARIKVQFHWDREGQFDENSSCWIRVTQMWAGKGWGSVSIPRIGQEVIVDFLEGDPDQPLVTGRVYNAEAMPPYALPAGGVVSGLKSNTHKGKGTNEMSMDDTAGKEKITINAQYDMITNVGNDQTDKVKQNRSITVDGTHTETIKGATKITISKGTYEHDVLTGTALYHVVAALTENYDDTQSTTVKNKISVSSTAANIDLSAKTSIKLSVGPSFIQIKDDGTITISAAKIAVTGGDEAKLGVGNQNVTCDKTKVALAGAAINSSAVGMHEISGAVVKIN